MILKLLLGITIFLHFVAAVIAVRLTRVTKYNLSWMLISAALLLMALRRVVEIIPFIGDHAIDQFATVFVWLGILASLFLATGVFLIQKIFRHMRDVEQKKRDYENRLLTAVIEAEERERKRFASDLHDGLGPVLSSIKMSLSSLHDQTPKAHQTKVLANVDIMVNEAIRSIKEISDNLSPHVLSNFGIEKALQNFINRIQTTGKIKFTTHFNTNDQRFNTNIETILYRVACELIQNTCKHSGANEATCSLLVSNGSVTFEYADNGIGYDIETIKEGNIPQGTGLYNIFSRVESLKGTVTFETPQRKGIFVTVQIPLHDSK
jgi:signal transduction histidine kinase